MKILYLECGMGAAGDMLNAALYDLLPEELRREYLAFMNAGGLPGVQVSAEPAEKCGIRGTHMRVTVEGTEEGQEPADGGHHDHAGSEEHGEHEEHEEHHDHTEDGGHGAHHMHTGPAQVEALLEAMQLPEEVQSDAEEVYSLLAEAESRVHGVPVEEIHFHEVGQMDAIADIAGCCLLIAMIAPDRIVCSPVTTGFGQVQCAHGILPVPAPATACLLKDIPARAGSVEGELCTPTGAALIRYFAESYGDMPLMETRAIGYGCGKKDFSRANVLRAMLGESFNASEDGSGQPENEDTTGDSDLPAGPYDGYVCELQCELDDMTPEEIAYAADRLMKDGALDVYTTAVGMKKGRPGVLLTVLCRPEDRKGAVADLFRHTATLGVRELLCGRYMMERESREAETPYGRLRVKHAEGYGAVKDKAEFDDLADMAGRFDLSLREVRHKTGADTL
jgi:uncharacterized protein (TIGR00299 family) protein